MQEALVDFGVLTRQMPFNGENYHFDFSGSL